MPGLVDDAISDIPNVFGDTFEEAADRVQANVNAMTAGVVASANAAFKRPRRHRGGGRGTEP